MSKQDYYPPPAYDASPGNKQKPYSPPQGPPSSAQQRYQQPPGGYSNYGNYQQPPPGQYYYAQQPQPIYVQQPRPQTNPETSCLFWFCGLLQLATCIELLVLLI